MYISCITLLYLIVFWGFAVDVLSNWSFCFLNLLSYVCLFIELQCAELSQPLKFCLCLSTSHEQIMNIKLIILTLERLIQEESILLYTEVLCIVHLKICLLDINKSNQSAYWHWSKSLLNTYVYRLTIVLEKRKPNQYIRSYPVATCQKGTILLEMMRNDVCYGFGGGVYALGVACITGLTFLAEWTLLLHQLTHTRRALSLWLAERLFAVINLSIL